MVDFGGWVKGFGVNAWEGLEEYSLHHQSSLWVNDELKVTLR